MSLANLGKLLPNAVELPVYNLRAYISGLIKPFNKKLD
jgi:hypothetical protein